MKPSPPSPSVPSGSVEPSDEAPGVPGLASWRGVYLAVLVSFVIHVVLLKLLTAAYD